MRKTYLFAIAIISSVAFFIGCRKGGNPIHPDPAHPGCTVMWAHQERFPGLQSQPQTFNIQAGVNQSITAANGTKFKFYPNSFKDAGGNIISSGTVNITLVEATTPGSMIANRTTSYYKGNMLQTGGQVSVLATMNGAVLTANKYGISFKQAAASETAMGLFYGTMENPDSSANWTTYDNTTAGSYANNTTIENLNDNMAGTATANFYSFSNCTNFGYVAAARSMGDGPSTNITVSVNDEHFSLQNTEVYIVSRSTNSAMLCYSYNYADQIFNLANPYDGFTGKVPVGATIDVVAIAYKDGDYFYSHQSGITVTQDMSVSLVMMLQTESDVKADLAKF